MQMLLKKVGILVAATIACFTFTLIAWANDYEPVKSLVEKYHSGNPDKANAAVRKLSRIEPKTHEDMEQLRKIFSDTTWRPGLYSAALDAIGKIRETSLDEDLIKILRDEKPFIEKIVRKEETGKSETEINIRTTTSWFTIEKLGKLKSKKAVPILKEYLDIPGYAYYASEALVLIGDKDANEELRERALKGERVNFSSGVEDETDQLFKDLQDESKKDQWGKLAKILINIRSPKTKPALKKLFYHRDDLVRHHALMAFFTMVTKDDAEDLAKIAKNQDPIVRGDAIKWMMYLRDTPFDDILIDVLVNDNDWFPRSKAARALGMKKVQKAVPYLEKALTDKNNYVRLEAFISLYILTDKKYDFDGRNLDTDFMAERQKKYPSINW